MKAHVRCSVREPARCATNSSWPSRIFFPSHSLVAPSVSLASWWHGPWISEDGRALTSLFGGLGIALKSVHGTRLDRSAFGHGHHVSQHVLPCSIDWAPGQASRHHRASDHSPVVPCPAAPWASLVAVGCTLGPTWS